MLGVRLFLAVVICPALWGQASSAPVVIDGREVIRVFGPLGTFSAADRALGIEERILVLARARFSGTLQTRSIPSEGATAVTAGPAILLAVTDVDAQSVGVPRDELAQRYAEAIGKAIEGYRIAHSWRHLLFGILKAILAWILLSATAWALLRSIRSLSVWSEAWVKRQAGDPADHRVRHFIWERGRGVLLAGIQFGLALLLVSEFSFVISFTFGLFPQTAGISTTLVEYLGAVFGRIGSAVLAYLPSGGFVAVVVLLTHYAIKVLKFFAIAIEHGDLPVGGMHPEMAKPTYQLLRIVVILFALVVAFPYLPGGNSEAFKGVSIFLGVLLSLGSSSSVSNVLAGLVLTYMRPFHAGDRVKIADTVGDVVEKSLLVTRLRTIKNVEVVIPNSSILGNQILNFSALERKQGLILNTTVTIGYDVPWRKVHDLLKQAALHTEGIVPDPPPFVLETSLNDFHVSYELNAYTDRANAMHNTYSRLHEAIQDSFNNGGVEIMSPTFYALRDGNGVTIPAEHLSKDYEAPAFRVKTVGTPQEAPARFRSAGD